MRLTDNMVKNDSILAKFHSLPETGEGQLRARSSEDEKQELLHIDSETEAENNLISEAKIREKHKKQP